jgi:cell division cycle 14
MPPAKQMENKTFSKAIEIIKGKLHILVICVGRLYWYCNADPPKNVPESFFFNIDSVLVYQGYNRDFGPLNLAQVHRYCIELYRILKDKKNQGVKIFHHCAPNFAKQANAAFLMSAFLVVCFKSSAEQAWQPF